MRIKIERDELIKALTLVQGVIEKRNTMPILANVLLDASGADQLRISATDLEVGIASGFRAKIEKPGRITIQAKNLTDIVRQLPPESITLSVLSNNDVEISCGKSHFKLHGLPAEDFPSLPEVEGQSKFGFPATQMAEMIDHTAFSISTDETRYNLAGVYLEQVDESSLRMVSSDGHRLSLIDRNLSKSGKALKDSVIIPRKGLMEIRKLSEGNDAVLEFAFNKSNCRVQVGETTLVVRLIDGEFPEYRQVLPDEGKQKKVLLNRELLQSALRRIAILSQEKTRGVRFQFEKNNLRITVNNPDVGEGEEEVELSYDHAPLEIGFNAKYFLDVLATLDCADVELYLGDSMSQGLIKQAGDDTFRAVIMPMKLL